METYTIEAAQDHFSQLLHRASSGVEILITESERPLAKLVPALSDADYVRRMKALRGIAPGLDSTLERDEDRV